MKTIRIIFHPEATIEERKRAINQALEKAMPFRFKRIELELNDATTIDYTGGFTQMILARAAVIIYALKPQS